jgi:hypothetical protein
VATLQELEQALVAADRAGAMNDARILAAALVEARKSLANQIPDVQVPGTIPQAPAPTFVDQIVGGGEAVLTATTGATGGTLGTLGGTLKGLAEQILAGNFGTIQANRAVEEAAMKGAQALTYAPRTAAGQEMAAAVGEAAQGLVPLSGLSGDMAVVGATSRPVVQAVRPVASAVAQKAGTVARAAANKVVPEALKPGAKKPSAGTMGSAGAAGVEAATLRQTRAEELPVPIQLTEGQKTREFSQQRFERETAKDPALGEPIRERFRTQNAQLIQNMDAFIDLTGAEAADLTSVGLSVDKALRSRAARDKQRIRTLYKEAEKAGEMEAPVQTDTLAQFLTESAPEAEVANVLKAARAKALQLGVLVELPDGSLQAAPSSLKTVELLRRSINNATNAEPTNIKFASDLKRLIDEATDGMGGDLYRQARAARSRYANDYENIGLVRNLLGTKRGSTDRAIAMEDVLRRSVIEPSTSLDTVKQVRRLLQTEGESGQQAWRDLQGGVLREIRDAATKNVARDEAGNPVVSAAALDRTITQLDRSGKLGFVFGKKGAETLRTLNDVAKDVLVTSPGAANTSNTASVILAALDMALIGSAGVPGPVLTSMRLVSNLVKDTKTKARIRRALGEAPSSKETPDGPQTLH